MAAPVAALAEEVLDGVGREVDAAEVLVADPRAEVDDGLAVERVVVREDLPQGAVNLRRVVVVKHVPAAGAQGL